VHAMSRPPLAAVLALGVAPTAADAVAFAPQQALAPLVGPNAVQFSAMSPTDGNDSAASSATALPAPSQESSSSDSAAFAPSMPPSQVASPSNVSGLLLAPPADFTGAQWTSSSTKSSAPPKQVLIIALAAGGASALLLLLVAIVAVLLLRWRQNRRSVHDSIRAAVPRHDHSPQGSVGGSSYGGTQNGIYPGLQSTLMRFP